MWKPTIYAPQRTTVVGPSHNNQLTLFYFKSRKPNNVSIKLPWAINNLQHDQVSLSPVLKKLLFRRFSHLYFSDSIQVCSLKIHASDHWQQKSIARTPFLYFLAKTSLYWSYKWQKNLLVKSNRCLIGKEEGKEMQKKFKLTSLLEIF